MIIWGGGRTEEEAQKALEAFQAEREALRDILTPGPDFPKSIQSQSLPGLNPGFYVVVLGICTPEEAKLPLDILQAFKPGVYARTAQVQAIPGGCPTVEHGLKLSQVEHLTKHPYQLTVVHLKSDTEEPVLGVPWLFRLYLRDETGKLVNWAEQHPRNGKHANAECSELLIIEKPVAQISLYCSGATGETGVHGTWTEKFMYRIGSGRVEETEE